MKLLLLTMARKSELLEATWNEFDFENRVWSIPEERMKKFKPHNVYLSDQSIDILIALKTCAGNSRFLLPSRYDANEPMCRVVFNRVTAAIAKIAKDDDLPLAPFTVHDLRRTASTLLNEVGFNGDWIGNYLAHEHGERSVGYPLATARSGLVWAAVLRKLQDTGLSEPLNIPCHGSRRPRSTIASDARVAELAPAGLSFSLQTNGRTGKNLSS